jgi:CRP/FNR family transcriptional regulator
VFAPGQRADGLLILLNGTLRIEQLAASGREIVLYRVEGGESCIMTAACLLAGDDHSATGIAETAIEALSLPRSAFDDLMARSTEFRGLIFRSYTDRITDLLTVIEEVAFRRIDIRLAGRLGELPKMDKRIALTQAQIATELGTKREVVSRQLQDFQRRGWVSLARGSVTVLDRAALRKLADSDQVAAL